MTEKFLRDQLVGAWELTSFIELLVRAVRQRDDALLALLQLKANADRLP
jgi:hypothetical protein